jgi:hypothetical protein
MLKLVSSGAASRFFLFYKVLGFAPVTIVNGKSVTRCSDVFFLSLSFSLGVCICYYSISNRRFFAFSTSEVANTGTFLTFVASIFIAMISMLCSFVFRHRAWKAILKLGGIEKKVKKEYFINASLKCSCLASQVCRFGRHRRLFKRHCDSNNESLACRIVQHPYGFSRLLLRAINFKNMPLSLLKRLLRHKHYNCNVFHLWRTPKT